MASQNEYLKDSSIDGGLANHEASDALKAILERRRQQKPSSSLSSRGRPVTEPSAMPRLNTFLPETQLKRTSKVKFWLHHHTVWGQSLKLVGASPELGNWVLSSGINMTWSEGDNWHCTVELPAGGVFEYKFVVVDHNSQTAVAWQSGNNSVLALRHADDFVEVFDNWHCSPGAKLVADGGAAVTRENRLLSWASEIEAQLTSQRQELRRARMELTAAQEEARLARSDAARARAALSESEAARIEVVGKLKKAETTNLILQSQMIETTASFREILEKATDLMTSIDNSMTTKKRTKKDTQI